MTTVTVAAYQPFQRMTDLRDLDPISLPELVGTAEMLTRVDRKYVVPRAALGALAGRLATTGTGSRTRVLEIDGRREFGYRSTYWDTADLASFRGAGQKRRRRFKVRTRTYLDSGASYLEVKTRGPRGTTVKNRIEHPEIHHARLDEVAVAYVDGLLADALVPDVAAAELVPTLTTRYHRITLATAAPGMPATRATIDTDLEWHAPGDAHLTLPDLVIVETKGTSSPSVVDRALWRMGHRPVRVSKYGTGLRAVRPELPDLKWHRVLHEHFLAA